MRSAKFLSILLAAALQTMPLMRGVVAVQMRAIAPSAWAIVLKLATVSAGLLSYHAVSGATTTIAAPYYVNGVVGKSEARQLGTSGQTAHSWSTTTAPLNSASFPLAPGLTLSKSGLISGTPTQASMNSFVITAWENTDNTGASVNATFQFTNISPPAITSGFASQAFPAGTNIILTETIAGSPPLTFIWKFQSTTVSGQTNASLSLTNVQTTNSGTYTLIVTNTGGAATNSATITVTNVPPKLITPLSDLIARSGSNVILSIAATGNQLSYKWLFNGTIITNATNSSLSFTNVAANQSGTYSVILSNAAGVLTNAARMLIAPPPTSAIAPLLIPAVNLGNAELDFIGLPGYSYTILYVDTLGNTNWMTLTNFAASFNSNSISLPIPPSAMPARFYRALISN